jgi:phospholipase/carboxylesterase
MNRIESRPENLIAEPPQSAYSVEMARYATGDASTNHALFAPLHYERNYAYPLVVWLHGPADDERQLKRVMPLVSMRNFAAVAPRGPRVDPARGGYRWEQTADQIGAAEQRVFDCIEIARKKFNIHPDRVFLAGLGCGGTMAFRVALNHPRRFAGALSLGGPFPATLRPLRRLNDVRNLPLWLASGVESRDYPLAQVCRDLRLFHSAGMSVSVRQYPGGNELTTLMLSDMNRWMMEQICPSSSDCPR